ncbi:MFS transporter [Micromonospora sp. NPDC049060]|uniref:MFS transporter n=1 Tax=Micromonospora sp. NPDC049060 TaxID=3154828 RepID=UPI0033E0E8B2
MTTAPAYRPVGRIVLAESLTLLGNQITQFALPLAAVLSLNARAGDMALVFIALDVPTLFVGFLFARVIERAHPVRVLRWTLLARAAAMAMIPSLHLAGKLTIPTVIASAFLIGSTATVHTIAFRSAMARLASKRELTRGNARLATVTAIAEVCAQAVAGFAVARLGGPLTLGLDTLLILGAAAIIYSFSQRQVSIRQASALTETTDETSATGSRAVAPRRFIATNLGLRLLLLVTALEGFGLGASGTVWTIHVTRGLQIDPTSQGVIYALGGVTAALSGMVAARVLEKVSPFAAVAMQQLVGAASLAAIAVAPPAGFAALAVLVAQRLIVSPVSVIGNVATVTYRQSVAPATMFAGVESWFGALFVGGMMLGRGAAGVLGSVTTTRTVLLVAVLAGAAAGLLAMRGRAATRRAQAASAVPQVSLK